MKRFILLTIVMLAAVNSAIAQEGQKTWISLDGSQPDTPPTVELIAEASGMNQTTVRVTVHGFYLTPVQTQYGTLQVIGMPGCSLMRIGGHPMLPQIRLSMAVPTSADTMSVAAVNVIQSQVLTGIRVMPSQPEQWEFSDEEFAVDDSFLYDEQSYTSDAAFPSRRARSGDRIEEWRGVPIARGYLHPMRARPASGRLVVDSQFEVTFAHQGDPLPPVTVSSRFDPVLRRLIINGDLLDGWLQLNGIDFAGNYLFLVRTDYVETSLELAWHKMMQGYDVTVLSTESIGGGECETLRDAVQDWHATLEPYADNYVLLIGESDDLEMCYTGFTSVNEDTGVETEHYSDYRIGVIEDDEDALYQDVGVGRLSVDDATDLENQIEKIIAYENSPPRVTGFYDDIVLAAHPEEGRDYIEACEDVADWPYYLHPLNFTERYGNALDGTVANVVDDINDGKVVVAYRGHGSSLTWGSWDSNGDSFWSYDVQGLTNGFQTPVVFSIACNNNGIDLRDDSIGEVWMEEEGNGAVFHYGSTRGSNTRHNNELIRWIFKLNYGDSNPSLWESTISAQFCARDLATCSEESSEKTLKQYLILGIPDLKVYQEAPYDILIGGLAPAHLQVGLNHLALNLNNHEGEAIDKGRITVFANGKILATRYADHSGHVSLDFTIDAPGEVAFTVNDDYGPGPVTSVTIPVSSGMSHVPAGMALAASCSPNPFNPVTSIRYELPQAGKVRVQIYDARGRLVRTLMDRQQAAGTGSVKWEGTDASGKQVASGLYFYEVRSAEQRIVGKMLLAK